MATGHGSVLAKDIEEFIKTGTTKHRTSLEIEDDKLISPKARWDRPIIMIPANMVMPDASTAHVFLINCLYWGSTERLRNHCSVARITAGRLGMMKVGDMTVAYEGNRFDVYTAPNSAT